VDRVVNFLKARKLPPIAAATTVWLWSGALCGLWSRVFDASAPSLWLSAGAALAAMAVGFSVPAQFFRAAQFVLRRWRPGGGLTMPPLDPAGPGSAVQVSRTLGVALIAAAAGSLLSVLCVLAGARIARGVMSGLLLGAAPTAAFALVIEFAGMLCWAIGAAVVWQAQTLTHGANDRDANAAGRSQLDWLAGLALAAAVASAAWRCGWEELPVGLAAGVAQVACGLSLIRWPKAARLAGAGPPAAGGPGVGIRLGALACGLIAALLLCVQLRGLADLLGATIAQQILFASASAAMAGWFQWRLARRNSAQGKAITAGAGVLVCSAMGLQLALAWLSLSAGERGAWTVYAALACQAPLAAGAAFLERSVRRRFFASGGRARSWAQWLLAGLAIGAAGGQTLIVAAGSHSTGMAVLVVLLAGAVIVGTGTMQGAARQAGWILAGAALLAAVTVAVAAAASAHGDRRPTSLAVGRWLTAWQRGQECGYLPAPRESSSWALDRRIAAILADLAGELFVSDRRDGGAHAGESHSLVPGRRWLVASCRPLIELADSPLAVTQAVADPAATSLPAWAGRGARPVLQLLRAGPFLYHGAIYSPIRADHPAARILFNRRTLRAVAARVVPGGTIIIHAACAGNDASPMLAVARTVHEMFGESLMAVRTAGDEAEILVLVRKGVPAGWAAAMVEQLQLRFGPDVVLAPGSRLAPIWADVPSVDRAQGPACGAGARVPLGEFRKKLAPRGP
jgi:hypothetical protein